MTQFCGDGNLQEVPKEKFELLKKIVFHCQPLNAVLRLNEPIAQPVVCDTFKPCMREEVTFDIPDTPQYDLNLIYDTGQLIDSAGYEFNNTIITNCQSEGGDFGDDWGNDFDVNE